MIADLQNKEPALYVCHSSAIIVFFLVVRRNEGKARDPPKEASFVVMTKTLFTKRGAPDLGQEVILEKTAANELSEDNIIARVTACREKNKDTGGHILQKRIRI